MGCSNALLVELQGSYLDGKQVSILWSVPQLLMEIGGTMKFLDQDVSPLGMGCWPIGGEMYAGDVPVGYSNTDDAESLRTIHAALDAGISVFDTAAAYGAGHSEKLLGQALKNRPESVVVTKIGVGIDEEKRAYTGADFSAPSVEPAINACLRRLDRDCIDLAFLHLNEMPVEEARPGFVELDAARQAGKIKAYGWSTDFTASAEAMIGSPGFTAVEHAMNVLVDAPKMQTLLNPHSPTNLTFSHP